MTVGAADSASPASSLSYISHLTPSPRSLSRGEAQYIPRRRHAAPPVLSPHRRAHSYADLLPFEINQLTAILSHGPHPSTSRDGVVWASYSEATNTLINGLGPKLRTRVSIPFALALPGFSSNGLCSLHRRLNVRPLEDILSAFRYEVEVRRITTWGPVIAADLLSEQQVRLLTMLDDLPGLWLSPTDFQSRFDRLPKHKYSQQPDNCTACILARIGGDCEVTMALGAMLVGAMKRNGMLSNRVRWCKEWVRHAVGGEAEDGERELVRMEKLGDELREARKRARDEKRGQVNAEKESQGKKNDDEVRIKPGPSLVGEEDWHLHLIAGSVVNQEEAPVAERPDPPRLCPCPEHHHHQHLQQEQVEEPDTEEQEQLTARPSTDTVQVDDSFPSDLSTSTPPHHSYSLKNQYAIENPFTADDPFATPPQTTPSSSNYSSSPTLPAAESQSQQDTSLVHQPPDTALPHGSPFDRPHSINPSSAKTSPSPPLPPSDLPFRILHAELSLPNSITAPYPVVEWSRCASPEITSQGFCSEVKEQVIVPQRVKIQWEPVMAALRTESNVGGLWRRRMERNARKRGEGQL